MKSLSPTRITKPNNTTHLLNISSKFTGTGGNTSSLAPKKVQPIPKVKKTGIFEAKAMQHILKHFQLQQLSSPVSKKENQYVLG